MSTRTFNCGRAILLVLAAWSATFPVLAQAQSTYVKVADEWATIQPGGARLPQFGNRNWNIEGGDAGAFASTGTLRFYMSDLVTQLNADFPGGWQVDNATLVVEHDDAGFSAPGGVSVFHFTNDDLAITNGMDSVFMGSAPDAAPGNFGLLPPSSLVFDDTGTADGQPVRVLLNDFVSMADMGTVTRVNDYTFAAQGDHNLDVLGSAGSLVDPSGAINALPDYGLSLPDADDTLATFQTELPVDMGDWIASGLGAIVADIEDGTDPLSFIFAATENASTVAATYKGNPFGDPPLLPPRIYLQVSSTGPAGVPGDYNNNGVVDAADYVVWRNAGQADTLPNDPTSGVVDQADYDLWRSRFGATSGSGGALGAVPEPATICLMALALIGVGLNCRRSPS